jgi:hypothetical protein
MSEQELGYGQGYTDGAFDERNCIVELLEDELESLKQYGRTELWGIHKAIHVIKSRGEEK